MLALSSFVASAGCSLALPTPAAEPDPPNAFGVSLVHTRRGKSPATSRTSSRGRPATRAKLDADATERDPRYGELLVRVTPTKVIAARNIAD
jgi:hypothetical protein